MSRFIFSTILSLSLLLSSVQSHVEMTCPAPRKSQYNKAYGSVDYSMNSPLGSFPCKGYPAGPSVNTYQAGSNIAVTLLGSATHNGGHCQFSLSYDGGNTFVVIKSVMGNCLVGTHDYSVQIPDSAPSSDKVVFAWSWINKTGNREFYMNCADISIKGTANGQITGPKMLVANLPSYPTIPEFTNGGDDGSDLYKKCETITVGSNGQSNGQGSSNSSNAPSQIYAPNDQQSNSSDSPSSSYNIGTNNSASPVNNQQNYSVAAPSQSYGGAINYEAKPSLSTANSYAAPAATGYQVNNGAAPSPSTANSYAAPAATGYQINNQNTTPAQQAYPTQSSLAVSQPTPYY